MSTSSQTSNSESWPNVARIAWIRGGLVAINNPGPDVEIGAGLDGLLLEKAHLAAYNQLSVLLRTKGLQVVGVTFVQTSDEAAGIIQPQFLALSSGSSWRARELRQSWREIAIHAGREGNMYLSDVAARLAAGLEASQARLGRLAKAYSRQLRSRIRSHGFEDFVGFLDGNTDEVVQDIHALFWELAVLRDSIAEFAAAYVFGLQQITSMAGLVKRLKSVKPLPSFGRSLQEDSDEKANGWLAAFTAYRNLFTHSAPIQRAAGIFSAVQETALLPHGVRVPIVYFPLPADAAKLASRRSKGPLFASFDDLVEASKNRPSREKQPDALEYLAVCLERFVLLLETLVPSSPVQPADLVITDADIVGDIQFSSE